MNGRPKIDAGGMNVLGKGRWVFGGSATVVENVEMFGARAPNKSGAAIRLDGRDLTVRGSYLHNNENGILTRNDAGSLSEIRSSRRASLFPGPAR
jgi:hypothetical protein